MDKDFFIGLSPDSVLQVDDSLPMDKLFRIARTYEISPGVWTKVRVPVQCHVFLDIVLRVSPDYQRIACKSKSYTVTFGDLEMVYSDYNLALSAVGPLETIYLNQVLGSKQV